MKKPQIKLLLLATLVFLGGLVFASPAQAMHQCLYTSIEFYPDTSCGGSLIDTFVGEPDACGAKPCGAPGGCVDENFIVSSSLPLSLSHKFINIAVPNSLACGHVPTANAGPDQTVTDSDANATESITLSGFGSSDPDGFIDIAAGFVWKEGATTVGAGVAPTVSLGIGIHTIILTVTDTDGFSSTDTVVITIIPVFAISVTHTCLPSSNCPTNPPTTADTVTYRADVISSLGIDVTFHQILISTPPITNPPSAAICFSFVPNSCSGSNPCFVGPLGPYLNGQKVCYSGEFKDPAGNFASDGKEFIVTSNTPPVVFAGVDKIITLPSSVSLNDGSVTDDGLPNPPAAVTTKWKKQSGPGTITFGNDTLISTTASFSIDGTYVLRLTASDSMLSAFDEVEIKVNPAPVTCAKGALRFNVGETTTDPCGSGTCFGTQTITCLSTGLWSPPSGCSTAGNPCTGGVCSASGACVLTPCGALSQDCCATGDPCPGNVCDSGTNKCMAPTCVAPNSCISTGSCTTSITAETCPAGFQCCKPVVPPPPCGTLGIACCTTGDPCPGLTCSAGVCITPPPPPPTCPDGTCGPGENCSNCAADCGVCPPPPPPSCVSPNSCVASLACSTGKTLDACPLVGDVCCLPPPPPLPGKPGGLVPCGRATNDPTTEKNEMADCTFCDFFILFKNIIDFIMWTLAPILGVLLIVLGGFLILTSRGSSSQYNQGKMFIIGALGGFVLMLIAWILINSVFSVLKLQDWTGLQVGKWWQVTCNVPVVAKENLLWLGNDTLGSVFKTDTAGAVLKEIPATPTTGIAFDGASLYFGNEDGSITKRTGDGSTVIDSFFITPTGGPVEDLAWDTKRLRLWRIEHNPSTVVKINPATKTKEATYPIDSADPEIAPRGGLGIAYDTTRDVLYVSFCQTGCASLAKGLVLIMNPDTGVITGELFRTVGFATAGLGYNPATDTLWVGDVSLVRNMSLTGAILSSFIRLNPGGFVDGLEFIN